MLSSLRNMFKVPDLRNKILFTLVILALYRFGSHVPTPGIDFEAVQQLEEQARNGGVLGFLSFFSGGGLTRMAIFGLGIMPYITSSIIMQVLTVVIPKLEQWQQMGAVGQKKITQWTRYLTVVLAVLQSTGLAFLFHNGGGGLSTTAVDLIPDFTVPRVLLIVLSLTAGTALIMWMGEVITQRGIGNGMSLIIFASVVSGIPGGGAQVRAEGGDVKFAIVVALAIMQSTGLAFVFHNGGQGFFGSAGLGEVDVLPNFTVPRVLLIVLSLTAGTAMVMWMGELITQRGIGNGMSLLIFASVVADIPASMAILRAEAGNFKLGIFLALVVGILVAIVIVENGQRRIPVNFAKRIVGRRMYGGQSTYIPLKVNQAGVIPVIFASSMLYLPVLLTNVLPTGGFWDSIRTWIDGNLLQPDAPVYLAIFGVMIVFFAYFYTAISFDPVKQADTIRKQGGFIPGIRPGPQTERHLAKILSRITLPGALFLAAIALAPQILLSVWGVSAFQGFGGVSLLIAVGVALETMKQIDSQLIMRNYESLLK